MPLLPTDQERRQRTILRTQYAVLRSQTLIQRTRVLVERSLECLRVKVVITGTSQKKTER